MRDPTGRDTVLSVMDSGLPLAVRCGYCPHRILIRRERLAGFVGNAKIERLPLVCSCGSKDVVVAILETPDEAEAFIEPNSTRGTTQPGSCHPTF